MSIELRQLKHAVAVAEHGSFARAALALHLSQSALSRSIQALEREVGTEIFVRAAAGVAMTEVGRQMLQHAKSMLQVAADLDRQIVRNPSLQTGQLSVGVAVATVEPAATQAVQRMLQEHPTLAIRVRSGFAADLLPRLRQGEVDLLIADLTASGGPEDDIGMQNLEEHPLVVVARAGHPLARRSDGLQAAIFDFPMLAIGRLRPELLSVLLEEQARAADRPGPRPGLPALTTNSPDLALRLMLDSDAVAAFAPCEIADEVDAGRVVPLSAPRWLTSPSGVAWMSQRPPGAMALAFCEHLVAAQAAIAADDRRHLLRWFPHKAAARAPA